MLSINGVVHTAEEVAEMFGIPFSKILKGPEFEINPERRSKKFGQQEMAAPAGTRFPAEIWLPSLVQGKPVGKKVQLRYFDYMQPELVGDKYVDKYFPTKVAFMGENYLVQDLNMELALYLYIHPLNEFSPFRGLLKEPFHYSFNDKEMKGLAAVSAGKELANAIRRAIEYSGEQLKTLAKGLGIAGVEAMLDESIQAELIEMAKSNPKVFLEQTNSNKTLIRGLIISGVDNGLFVEDKSAGRHRWIWGYGSKKGVELFELFMQPGASSVEMLIEHIFANLNNYLPELRSATLSYSSEKKAEQNLDGMALLDLNDFFSPSASQFGGSTNDISQENVENIQTKQTASQVVKDAKDLVEKTDAKNAAKKVVVTPAKPTTAKKTEPVVVVDAKSYEEIVSKYQLTFKTDIEELNVLSTILEQPSNTSITEKELVFIQDRFAELNEEPEGGDNTNENNGNDIDDDDIPSFLRD